MRDGVKGHGAPQGRAKDTYWYGGFTCEAVEARRYRRDLIRRTKVALGLVG